jgi:hypothetical protein
VRSPRAAGNGLFIRVPRKRPARARLRPWRRGLIARDEEGSAMFGSLLRRLRRWITYRPERRYMRGGRSPA